MKSTFLDTQNEMRRYLEMAIAEYSDMDARAAEQQWLNIVNPTMGDLQRVSLEMFKLQRPLTADNFKKLLERLKIESH